MTGRARTIAQPWLVLACLTGILGASGPANAQPTDGDQPGPATEADLAATLVYAENTWLYGDFQEVIDSLQPHLFPVADPEAERETLIAAYELLGASHFMQTGREAAQPALLALLRLEPDHRMDPLYYPASMLEFLNQIRAANQVELDAIREARREEEQTQEGGQLRFVERRVEEQSPFVSILPFGIGHFANRETEWGIFYLVTELALGGTSMAMFLANEADITDDGWFPDPDLAQTRQNIQIGTGIAFFALLAANIAHGALIHQDVVQTSYGILDEPPEDFLPPQNAHPLSFTFRLRF